MKKALVIAILLIFGMAAGVVAMNYDHHGMFSATMSNMDGDGDGTVTFDEFNDFMSAGNKSVFDALDTNGDSVIDADEWTYFIEAHGGGMMNKGDA